MTEALTRNKTAELIARSASGFEPGMQEAFAELAAQLSATKTK